MASLQKKASSYYCQFLYQGRRHTVALGKVSEVEAVAFSGQVDYLLLRLKQGLLTLPDGVAITKFVLGNGQTQPPPATAVAWLTLAGLRDRYLEAFRHAQEATSLASARLHFKHLVETLGAGFDCRGLRQSDVQRHVNRRSNCRNAHGDPLSPATVKAEVVTFRAAWNWAVASDLLSGPFPGRRLVYPKAEQKPPFQTRAEIERKLAAGGLNPREARALWDALYLTREDLAAFLAEVSVLKAPGWFYPALCFAAHTGARRSEIFRVRADDVDFATNTVLVREKKRVRGARSTRRVPLSAFLITVMKNWTHVRPGGPFLFAWAPGETRRKRKLTEPVAVTKAESHHVLRDALSCTSWSSLPGYHVLRHSAISAFAAAGVDQRLIDEWVGHTTEEMRRRYRHLAPDVARRAMDNVFAED